MNPTLIVSSPDLPSATALADAARQCGWSALTLDNAPDTVDGEVIYYGRTDRVAAAAERFGLALLEPPLDLLTRLRPEFRRRTVEFATFGDLHRLRRPAFVKPADPLDRCFDAGVYLRPSDIRAPHGITAETPVLVAEPVEWSLEYRCFVLDGRIVAWSPYMSYGRPAWRPFRPGRLADRPPRPVQSFIDRLTAPPYWNGPPAVVIDVGAMDDRGWAVVEFNPVWCAGILGADPRLVLTALRRANGHAGADNSWQIRDWPSTQISEGAPNRQRPQPCR